MIRPYDIVIAICWAWLLLNFVFVPYIGIILAYGLWQLWDMYCNFRLEHERGMQEA